MDEEFMVCCRCYRSQLKGLTRPKCSDQRCYFYAGNRGLRTNGLSSSPSKWPDELHMSLDSLQKKDIWTSRPHRFPDSISCAQGRPRVASNSDITSLRQDLDLPRPKNVAANFRTRLLSLPMAQDTACALVEDTTPSFLPCTAFSAPLVPDDVKQVWETSVAF